MTGTTTAPAAKPIAWAPVFWIGGLHLGALLALNPHWFSWSALAVCLVLHWLTQGIGICLTYHRLLTHRSFVTRPRWLEYLLAALGCCASEGGPVAWVADHRRHHAHSDDDLDPHSSNRGFTWAHMFWWITPDIPPGPRRAYLEKWAPDLIRDPIHAWLDTYHFLFPIAMGVGLYSAGGMPWLVWGCFVRSILVLHTTWLVNSAAHLWGYRSHATRDRSTNNWWVALLTYGEGWHNNHHAFQTSARHGLRWWEIDMTYWAVRGLSLVGLAREIKLPKTRHEPPSPPAPTFRAKRNTRATKGQVAHPCA